MEIKSLSQCRKFQCSTLALQDIGKMWCLAGVCELFGGFRGHSLEVFSS